MYVALILNNLLSKNGNPEDIIKDEDLNSFMTTMSDVFVTILDNGLVEFDVEKFQFRSKHTKDFFLAGLKGLQAGKVLSTLKLLLDFLLLQKARDNSVSAADLFEFYLLSLIIPILDGYHIKEYVDYIVEFCSGNTQFYQIAKFVKYIDIYKVDSLTLKGTRDHIEEIRKSPDAQRWAHLNQGILPTT